MRKIFTAQIGVQWSGFLCHTQKDRWVRCHRKGVAVTLVRLRMSPSAISKQPTAGTLSWRFIIKDGTGGRPQADMLSWQFLGKCVITLKVAGSCHHLLVSWSCQPIAWLGFFGGITRIAPELDCTVGSLAMLCHRMHEL